MEEATVKRYERIDSVDVLRGFTLLGIVLVHFTEQYYAGAHPQKYGNFTEKGMVDAIVSGFVGIFISGKFFMIFSFLFGWSFYLQLSKGNSSPSFFIRFAWRLTVLFLIGLVHSLHYRGDILTVYAVLGLGLILSYRLPNKALLLLALFLTLNIPSMINRGYQAIANKDAVIPKPTANSPEDKVEESYFETLKSGSYSQIIKANIPALEGKVQFQFMSGRIYITFGLFLLGLYAGRMKVFENLGANRPLLKKMIRYSLWSLLACVILSVAFFGAFQLAGVKLPEMVAWMVGGFVYDVFNAALAAIYCAVILLLFLSQKWHPRLMHLYPVGRMGLTTYLMQSMFGFLIFFGVGLGMLGEIGAGVCFALGLAIFFIQILFSKWWLKRYRFGIFEWLWRSLTYGTFQPLAKGISMVAAE